jgi:hypothetical protein
VVPYFEYVFVLVAPTILQNRLFYDSFWFDEETSELFVRSRDRNSEARLFAERFERCFSHRWFGLLAVDVCERGSFLVDDGVLKKIDKKSQLSDQNHQSLPTTLRAYLTTHTLSIYQ